MFSIYGLNVNKICKFCNKPITELTAAYKLGKLRNECKPCRSKINVKYKQLTDEQKSVPCEYCNTGCIKKFFRAFCSEKCRFMGFVKKEENGCWIWQGTIKRDGYGVLMVNGIWTRAHRHSYELFKRYIKRAMRILHSCHNTKCVNPDHLREGTPKENSEEMVAASRQAKGESCSLSKLNNQQVMEIRKLRSQGLKVKEISMIFNMTIGAISDIVNYKTWKHI